MEKKAKEMEGSEIEGGKPDAEEQPEGIDR
jgi:hypothetical protein